MTGADSAERRRLAALVPLQAVVLMIGLHTLTRSGVVLQVIGWMLVAGAVLTLVGLLLAVRGKARGRRD